MIKVIYHGNHDEASRDIGCTDGFGAALMTWLKFRNDAIYIPANYGKELDEVSRQIEPGDRVYVLDLNCTRAQLKAITDAAGPDGEVVFLDHHRDSLEQLLSPSLEELALSDRDIDPQRSGAMLAHDHFFPGQIPPPLLKVLQQRDLWQDDRDDWTDNQIAFAGIRSVEQSLSTWEQELLPLDMDKLMALGTPTYMARQQRIKELVKGHVMLDILGEEIPAAYAPECWSEVCQELCKMHDSPMALAWRPDLKDPSIRRWDVRSLKGTRHSGNAFRFAKLMGGGGHPDAAGFQLTGTEAIAVGYLLITPSPETPPNIVNLARKYHIPDIPRLNHSPHVNTGPQRWKFRVTPDGWSQICQSLDADPIAGLRLLADTYELEVGN